MKKIFVSLVTVFTFAFVPAVALATESEAMMHDTPTTSSAPAMVNSFELFWPIVAGKVRGESLYFLKNLKEKVREMLIFSDFKKSDYNKTLSEKRTLEAEKLLVQIKDYSNASITLGDAQISRQKAYDFWQKADVVGGNDTNNLKDSIVMSLEKQRALLSYILIQIPDEQKSLVEENLARLNEILAKLQ